MNIKRWDWDKGSTGDGFVVDVFPDKMFQPFLEWLFTTKLWQTDPSLVNQRVLRLQREMSEYRQGRQSHREAETFLRAPSAVAVPTLSTADKRRAALARARAAKKAKRDAKELAHA